MPQDADCQHERCGGEHEEHAAPTDELAEGAADRSRQDLREHDTAQEPAERDLPVLVGGGVGNVSEADRDEPGTGAPGQGPQQGQRFEIGREGTAGRRCGIGDQRPGQDARLADPVGNRTDNELQHAVGDRERCQNDGHQWYTDVEVACDDVEE